MTSKTEEWGNGPEPDTRPFIAHLYFEDYIPEHTVGFNINAPGFDEAHEIAVRLAAKLGMELYIVEMT